jgi:hypothetical protein
VIEETISLQEALTPEGAAKISSFGGVIISATLFGNNYQVSLSNYKFDVSFYMSSEFSSYVGTCYDLSIHMSSMEQDSSVAGIFLDAFTVLLC